MKTLVAVSFACIIFPTGIACYYRQREKRTLQKIDRMLEEAIRGDFQEEEFDESLLSAVEAKLSHYLSASEVSARNLKEEKDKIKTLISDISHQTKTPLSNVLLYTQLLAENDLPEGKKELVEALQTQTLKLQFLIDALVKTSRLETGILALQPERNSVRSMLEKAMGNLQEKAAEKKVSLFLEPGDTKAVFDPKWTEEAVCNLLDNAVKYTQPGGEIKLSVKPYELFCRIDVADNGMGIAQEEQTKIFGRFYRTKEVAEQTGVGIGLYLVRQIAAGQGGYVKVSSEPGKGSTFSLFLPTS